MLCKDTTIRISLCIVSFIAALFGLLGSLNKPVFAATQCVGSCCVTCPNSMCTHIISASPCNTHCDGPTQHGCGGAPPPPPPTPRPTACTPNATRCSGCDRVRCLSDGSGEVIVDRGACCSNPTPPPPPPNKPPTAVVTYPSNGAVFDPSQPLTISATATDSDGSVTQVDFIVDGVSVGIDTTAPYSINYTTPSTGGNKSIIARARDDDGAFGNSAPVTITIRPSFTISGTVYEDNENLYQFDPISGRCVNPLNPSLSSVQPGSSPQVTHIGGESASVSSTGSYSINAFGRNYPSSTVYPLRLQNFDANEYRCSCPEDCTLAATVGPNQTNVNFYVSRRKDPWFQVSGGDVHAQGRSLTEINHVLINPVPTTCEEEASCRPFSLLSSVASQANTSGLLTTYQGQIDVWSEPGDQVVNISQGHPSRHGKSRFPEQLSYRYFVRLVELGLNLTSDFTDPANAQLPDPEPSKVIYYHGGDLAINSAWHVPASQKLIVFVGNASDGQPGNLELLANAHIEVDQGGFLAFIVSGDIRISPEIGHSNAQESAPNLTGLFIASNAIIAQGRENVPDKKLVVDGSLIGINEVHFNRDYKTLDNNHFPVIEVNYRPDLLINAPNQLKRSFTSWRALAP